MAEVEPNPFVHTIYNPEYSPDGQSLSFITQYRNESQVWKLTIGQRSPAKQLITKDDISFIKYIPGTSNLILGMDFNGNEREQLFLLKENDELIALTKSPKHIHRFGACSPDGEWISWASNRRNPAYFDIYIQNLETLEIQLVHAEDQVLSIESWFPDGKSLLISKTYSPLYNDLGVLSLTTGEVDWVTGRHGELADYRYPLFNKSGDSLYLLTNLNREFFGLALIQISTKNVSFLEIGSWDFDGLMMNKNRDMLAFTMNENGVSKGYVLDLNTSRISSWETPPGVITNLRFSPTQAKLAFAFQSPTNSPNIWVLDLLSYQANQLTYNPSLLMADKAIETTLISYPSFDQLTIHAYYYEPKNSATKKKPVVIYLHGGPEVQSRPTFNPLFQLFLDLGYAVCTPNIRGSTGYGKSFTHLDDRRKRMDPVKDIVWLVDWLKANREVDPQKIVIVGGSYGGLMVFSAISHYPNLWAAAVGIAGISSLRTFLTNTSPWRKKQREFEYGTVEKDGPFFDQFDPLRHVDQIKAPLLVIHGLNDPRVPISESEQLVDKLEARNHPVKFFKMQNEGHAILKSVNKEMVVKMVVDFIKFQIDNRK